MSDRHQVIKATQYMSGGGRVNEWTFYPSILLKDQVKVPEKGTGFRAETCTAALHL